MLSTQQQQQQQQPHLTLPPSSPGRASLPLSLPRRGLALLPNVGVVSASHDQTLKVWTFSGECIAELAGHTALVYACAATADGLVASGSEDSTAKLWHADGTCLQGGGGGGGGGAAAPRRGGFGDASADRNATLRF